MIPRLTAAMLASLALAGSTGLSAEGTIRTRSLEDIQNDLHRRWDAPASGTHGPDVHSRNHADTYADNNRQWDARPSGDPKPSVVQRDERALLKDHHRDWGPDRPEGDPRMAGR